jgi:hypothetical protein
VTQLVEPEAVETCPRARLAPDAPEVRAPQRRALRPREGEPGRPDRRRGEVPGQDLPQGRGHRDGPDPALVFGWPK